MLARQRMDCHRVMRAPGSVGCGEQAAPCRVGTRRGKGHTMQAGSIERTSFGQMLSASPPPFTEDPYDPAVVQRRLEEGRRAETTPEVVPPGLVGLKAASYFRTYEQVKAAMFELQAAYPNLVRVEDVGDSAEKVAGMADRDILALVLTNQSIDGAKPTTVHSAGIHAREVANPEVLMTFAKRLLEGHGTDPEATMMLNTRETVLVPILNPDGHAVVENGYAGTPGGNIMQRKSTAATTRGMGVDLNRNFDYKWGGPGASASPRNETYRGPSAGSEPETKALQQLIASKKPAFFMDWHSHSKLNLYPWGDTREPTKDHNSFKAVAQKLTTYNGYTPQQAVDLYPTSGTTEDYGYGAHGVPSLTIETGTQFHQTDADFQKTLAENLPVLSYIVKTADAPFQRVLGPDALDVKVDAAARTVSARITDQNNGKQMLAGAELVLDPHAAPGTGVALQAADGAFDQVAESVVGPIDALTVRGNDATAGALVFIRGRDAGGNWGPLSAQWLTGPAAAREGARR